MQTFDQLNTRYGRGTIKLGCALSGKKPNDDENVLSWELRREYLSPRYTTNINDIPVVY